MPLAFTIVEIEYSGSGLRRNYLVEIAMIRINHDGSKTELHHIIKPPNDISDFVFSLVDFDKTALETAPLFSEIASEIADFCADTVLVGLHVRYIYALMRKAFKQADSRFVRKQICLSRMVENACAEAGVKSTGGLCRKMGISFSEQFTLPQRAQCMAQLFEQLFRSRLNHASTDKSLVHQTAFHTKLPPNLSFAKVENLPNAMGVYYFLDHKGRIVYLGKSNDIKKRVLSHFNSDLDDFAKYEMKNAIYDLQYRLTGSELIALLLESDEIKRYMPKFNRAQRRIKYTQGIYITPQPDGYLHFQITTLGNSDGMLLMKFSNKWRALRFILSGAVQYGLNLELCGLGAYQAQLEAAEAKQAHGEMLNVSDPANHSPHLPDLNIQLENELGENDYLFTETQAQPYLSPELTENTPLPMLPNLAMLPPETAPLHNSRVMQLLSHYSYPAPNMLIIDQGKNTEEISVVLIANNVYAGYAYLPKTALENPNTLPQVTQEYLIPFRDNPDVQRIIRTYLRQHEQDLKIITF